MADYSELFLKDSIDKQMTIVSDDELVNITNKELHSQNFELTESLCSEKQLKFGCCEASSIKFKISYVRTSMKGKWLTVKIAIGGNEPFQIGRYKVFSDTPTADREYREIVAYDTMYDIINTDVADWYNTILPTDESTVSLKEFRDSFFQQFGITQETIPLPQDTLIVQKTIQPTEISGKDVITSICEINGCFGHIGRDGKFQYIFLRELIEGLYPRNDLFPRDDLYPADAANSYKIAKSYYIKASYEDFKTQKISKLQIRQNENDIGCIYGTGNNTYVVEDNFLVYGKNASELEHIAEVLYEQLKVVTYRPTKVTAIGNITLNVGDGIRLSTKYEIIYTYILQRTLKGIQALTDEFTADGEEIYNGNVNSVNKSIIQLRGKTNELTRNVDETNSRLTDTANGLQSQITQNAGSISAEVTRATTAEGNLSSRITLNSENITSEVTRASTAEGNLSTRITQNADSITAEITRAGTAEGNLSTRITANATSITSEVARATTAEGSLSSRITQNADAIDLRVTKDGVVSAINVSPETITISANKINVDGLLATSQFQAQTARITTLEGDHVSVNSFNALSGRVGTIESDYITTGELNAVSGRIDSLESIAITTDNLSAQTINGDQITGLTIAANQITSGRISTNRLSTSVITTDNFSAQNIDADKITSGTIDTARLDVDYLASTAFSSKTLSVDYVTVGSSISTGNINVRGNINNRTPNWQNIKIGDTWYWLMTG